MAGHIAFAAVLPFLMLPGILGLQWTGSVPDGQILHACVGSDVTIDWQYATDPQDNVFSISWFFDGRSQEMVAMSSHGAFVPLPAFGSRVAQTTNAGVKITGVTVADSGRYTVEINGEDANGAFTVSQHVQLQVADHLLTTDGQLHVTQSPHAVHDNATDEWLLELNCGTFTYAGMPPFQVEWLAPSGARYNSTSYRNNQFQLLVPNPVEEGSYTCEISQQTASLACLPQGQTAASEFAIEAIEARLALMEANQQALRTQNAALKNLNQQLKAQQATTITKIASLETSSQQQQQLMSADQQCCQQSQTALTSLATDLHQAETVNQTDETSMMTQLQGLTSQIQAAQTATSHAATAQPVTFHAEWKTHMSHHTDTISGQRLTIYDLDLAETHTPSDVNQGHGLDGSSSNFTAPADGTYFLIASSIMETTNLTLLNDAELPLQLVKDDGKVISEGLRECQAVVQLSQGEVVHLQSSTHEWDVGGSGWLASLLRNCQLGSGGLWGSTGLTHGNCSNFQLLRSHIFDVYFDGFRIE